MLDPATEPTPTHTVDDSIIDRGAQMLLEHLERCQCGQWACAGPFKVHPSSS